VNEALLLTARHGKDEVELTELLQGLSRTRYGVDGRNGSGQPGSGLAQRIGQWVLGLQPPPSKAVKVAAS
jgi:hypothetical protein